MLHHFGPICCQLAVPGTNGASNHTEPSNKILCSLSKLQLVEAALDSETVCYVTVNPCSNHLVVYLNTGWHDNGRS